MTSWPWDPDRLGSGRQNSLEGGLGIRAERGMVERGGGLRSPISLTNGNGMSASRYTFPAPPPAAHTQGGYGSPYVTVPLHHAHQSVPDLAYDLGTLQITNFAPGDLSGGESSRASTALGTVNDPYPAECGTPFQLHRPCFLGVENGGLDVPWQPLRVRRSGIAGGKDQGLFSHGERLDEPLPLPYPEDVAESADGPPAAHTQRQESWAASIRMNLVNAFNAVVGSNPSQVPTASDMFTYAPHRNSQRDLQTSPRVLSNACTSVERTGTAGSSSGATGWSLEACQNGAGLVHIRNASEVLPAEDPFADNVHLPPPAFIPQRDRSTDLLRAPAAGSVTRTSSMYSTASLERPRSRICDDPPRLPTIDSLTRLAGEHDADTEPQEDENRRRRGRTQRRKQTRKLRRPTIVSRKSSSQDSAMSVGSEMSRTPSAASELTDGERFAKQALRERRRRVMEMNVGRNKTRRPRATMLSRRRSQERTKQQRD
ncbi:hypothetical protein BN946_scf184493.g21 [Trametes cinnabarina]|uniref:Uncharacterized protein n=1 Tax=Pycnoporus cinnabarinus TaxID=5643 RepID=A0A060STD2_PYCCI|nr:hypothetical protein BN946_scf184493.g21 [Trametes cinnabarina]